MHFTHFSNALHTFVTHLSARFSCTMSHIHAHNTHIYKPSFLYKDLSNIAFVSSSNVVFSQALHFPMHCIFSLKDMPVICVSCLVSLELDLHCIFFPWIWSFFHSILEFLLVSCYCGCSIV